MSASEGPSVTFNGEALEARLSRLEDALGRVLDVLEAKPEAAPEPPPGPPPEPQPSPVVNQVIPTPDGSIVLPVPYSPPPRERPYRKDVPMPAPASLSEDAMQRSYETEFLRHLRMAGVDQSKRPAGYELDA